MSYSRRKLMKALKKHGCVEVREGGRHTVIKAPNGLEIAIPRHNELQRGTVRGICEDAGLEWQSIRGEIS